MIWDTKYQINGIKIKEHKVNDMEIKVNTSKMLVIRIKDGLFLEKTQLFTHKHENMNLYIIMRRTPTWIKSTSMLVALTNQKREQYFHTIP